MKIENIEVSDPTLYDFDLFSPFIYQNQRNIFYKSWLNHKYFFCPHRFYFIATAGINFKAERFLWEKNNDLMTSILNSNLEFDIDYPKQLNLLLTAKFPNQDITQTTRQSYLVTFEKYARKGLFAFDKKDISDPSSTQFSLVVYPNLNFESYKMLAEFVVKILDLKIQLDFDENNVETYLNRIKSNVDNPFPNYGIRDMSRYNLFNGLI